MVRMWDDSPTHCCECKMVQLLFTAWQFTGLNRHLLYGPAFPFLGMYPGKCSSTETYVRIFIADLFITASN